MSGGSDGHAKVVSSFKVYLLGPYVQHPPVYSAHIINQLSFSPNLFTIIIVKSFIATAIFGCAGIGLDGTEETRWLEGCR